jgi:hypothetical protein
MILAQPNSCSAFFSTPKLSHTHSTPTLFTKRYKSNSWLEFACLTVATACDRVNPGLSFRKVPALKIEDLNSFCALPNNHATVIALQNSLQLR